MQGFRSPMASSAASATIFCQSLRHVLPSERLLLPRLFVNLCPDLVTQISGTDHGAGWNPEISMSASSTPASGWPCDIASHPHAPHPRLLDYDVLGEIVVDQVDDLSGGQPGFGHDLLDAGSAVPRRNGSQDRRTFVGELRPAADHPNSDFWLSLSDRNFVASASVMTLAISSFTPAPFSCAS